jgi:hypothetical protein
MFDPFNEFREELFEQLAPSLSRDQFSKILLDYLGREHEAPEITEGMMDEVFRRACEFLQMEGVQKEGLQRKVKTDLERSRKLLRKIRESIKKLALVVAQGATTGRLPMEKACADEIQQRLKAFVADTDELLGRQRIAANLFGSELSSKPLREFTWDLDLYLNRECKLTAAARDLVIAGTLKAIGGLPDTADDLVARIPMRRSRALDWIKKQRLDIG